MHQPRLSASGTTVDAFDSPESPPIKGGSEKSRICDLRTQVLELLARHRFARPKKFAQLLSRIWIATRIVKHTPAAGIRWKLSYCVPSCGKVEAGSKSCEPTAAIQVRLRRGEWNTESVGYFCGHARDSHWSHWSYPWQLC